MSKSAETCTDCRFWHPVEDEDGNDLGQCHRYPPGYEGWPMTFGHDWCGEWSGPAVAVDSRSLK